MDIYGHISYVIIYLYIFLYEKFFPGYFFRILSLPQILIKMYLFNVFSLKTKKSGKKTRQSTPRSELLRVKVHESRG